MSIAGGKEEEEEEEGAKLSSPSRTCSNNIILPAENQEHENSQDVTSSFTCKSILRERERGGTQELQIDPCGRKGEGELADPSKNVKCACWPWLAFRRTTSRRRRSLFSSSSLSAAVRSFVRSFVGSGGETSSPPLFRPVSPERGGRRTGSKVRAAEGSFTPDRRRVGQ